MNGNRVHDERFDLIGSLRKEKKNNENDGNNVFYTGKKIKRFTFFTQTMFAFFEWQNQTQVTETTSTLPEVDLSLWQSEMKPKERDRDEEEKKGKKLLEIYKQHAILIRTFKIY